MGIYIANRKRLQRSIFTYSYMTHAKKACPLTLDTPVSIISPSIMVH